MVYKFCGSCVCIGTFSDGDKAGLPWTSVKVLLGKHPDQYGRCKSCVTVKATPDFSTPAAGSVGAAFFDEYGRIISFDADDNKN